MISDFKDVILKNSGIIMVKVIPKSSCDKIIVDENGEIKIKVRAVPENGKANDAIVELLHKTLKIPKKNVEIISGFTNSIKKIRIDL